MKYILAYGLVIILAQFCLTLGTLIVAFAVSGALAWAPERFRGVVAGTLSGIGGVTAAVAFGYFVFRLILGSSEFNLISLLASAIPLLIPIYNDFTKSRELTATEAFQRGMFVDVTVGAQFKVVGYVLGLVLSFLWFFFMYETAS
jgi:hypothetical protein